MRINCTMIATFAGLSLGIGGASAQLLRFEQVNWQSGASTTLNSNWGRAVIDYTGSAQDLYLNVNVGGRWVVQNALITSPSGAGAAQSMSTFFNLGNVPGVDVSLIDVGWSLAPDMVSDAPPVSTFGRPVDDLSALLGNEGGTGQDWGAPGVFPDPWPKPPRPPQVVLDGNLPGADKVPRLPQGPDECVPGAIATSMGYLKSRGAPANTPATIQEWKDILSAGGYWLGAGAGGTALGWWDWKAQYLKDHPEYGVTTEVAGGGLTYENVLKVIQALNEGKDVEVGIEGHRAMISSFQLLSDGTFRVVLHDDNQNDGDKADPPRTVIIGPDGKIDGRSITNFVIEGVPAPGAFALVMVSAAAAASARRRGSALG